jgi:hypothetical protein
VGSMDLLVWWDEETAAAGMDGTECTLAESSR